MHNIQFDTTHLIFQLLLMYISKEALHKLDFSFVLKEFGVLVVLVWQFDLHERSIETKSCFFVFGSNSREN